MFKSNFLHRLLFAVGIILFIFNPLATTWSATYYVSMKNGSNSDSGKSPDKAWKTVSKINRTKFKPGDKILFKRGDMWRERLTVSSSGSSAAHITYGSYGSGTKPIINGSVIVKNWKIESVNGKKTIYSATKDIDGKPLSVPNQVFYNSKRLSPNNKNIHDLKINEWKWVDTKLYINVTGNPSAELVEASDSVRYSCITVSGKHFINLNNLTIKKANQDGLLITNGSSNIHVNNLFSAKNYWAGVNVLGGRGKQLKGFVKNSLIEDNGGNGIHFSDVQQWKISNNIVSSNCRLKEHDYQQHIAGIKLNGFSSVNNIVEYNIVSGSVTGCGIWIDFCGSNNIIRYNKVFNNFSAGIMNEITSGTQIYYNLSNNNGNSYIYEESQCIAAGIFVWGRSGQFPHGRPANDNLIYNNLCFGNTYIGIIIQGDGKSIGIINNNMVKNNISVNNLTQLRLGGGAENTIAKNVIENNCFGIETSKFIEWGWGRFKSTYSEWEGEYVSSTFSIKSDPVFVDIANKDFRLKSSSPCINSGVNVGLVHDFDGIIIKDTPDIGPYEWSPKESPLQNPKPN